MDWLFDMGLVRWLARLFSQERLEPLVRWFMARLTGDPVAFARSLFITALVLAVLVAVVDQLLYWTRPDQIARARRSLARVRVVWRHMIRRLRRALDRLKAGGQAP